MVRWSVLVAGALAVPYWLLPAFGVAGALHLAVGASVVVGVVAMFAGRRESAEATTDEVARSLSPSAKPKRAALAVSFASGFFVLAFETLAFRDAALVHSSSTHAFAAVLAMVLAALAVGAWGAGVLGSGRGRFIPVALAASGARVRGSDGRSASALMEAP